MITDSVLQYIGIAEAERVLDPEQLEALLERPASLERLRVKPGRSLLASWSSDVPETSGRGDLARHGWVALLTDPDKAAGVLRRAARGGATVTVHRRDRLLSGGIETDPKLARPLAHARKLLDDSTRVDVVRYNPARRLILRIRGPRVPDGDSLLRISPKGLGPLLRAEEAWSRSGAPVPRHRWWGLRTTAAVVPFWGHGDLSDIRDIAAARACGRAIATVHGSDPHMFSDEASNGISAVPTAPATPPEGPITALLPRLTSRIRLVNDRLRLATRNLPATAVPIHGDLTPDQVLTDGAEIRIVDLDRARIGSAAQDLGTWGAACLLLETPELNRAFLDGYRELLPVPDLAPWICGSLLASALEPFRNWCPDWALRIERRVDLAAHVIGLDDGGPRPVEGSLR
ncbi:phosphotransferase [Actinomycetaceae bacterium L2_0104]